MDLEVEDIEESLSRLRAVGAVAEVQGSGRVEVPALYVRVAGSGKG